jgi:hypothetical protein
MSLWSAITRALTVMAVLGVFFAPQGSADVTWAQTAVAQEIPTSGNVEAMADMPCCPPEQPSLPDCGKGCPLATLCYAKLMPIVMPHPAPAAPGHRVAAVLPENDAAPVTLTRAPPSRPPEA